MRASLMKSIGCSLDLVLKHAAHLVRPELFLALAAVLLRKQEPQIMEWGTRTLAKLSRDVVQSILDFASPDGEIIPAAPNEHPRIFATLSNGFLFSCIISFHFHSRSMVQ